MLPAPADTGTSKRTRTNVRQSKFGCFTCKARRVKCDEAKPTCRRCLASKRTCLGYPRGAPPGPRPETTTPSPAASPQSCIIRPNPGHSQSRFVNLTCTVVGQGPRRAKSDLEIAFWSCVVPQLTHSIPSVEAAAAAFGASYYEHVLKGNRSSPGFEAAKQYSQALRLVQLDLSTLQHGLVPCIVACLFLACTEVLQRQIDNGLLHLQGAFALLISSSKETTRDVIDMEGVSLLLQKLDLHTATYAVGRSPDLPPAPSFALDAMFSDSPDRALFNVLHSCYHFTSIAARYKYISRRLVPPELLIEQGRHLGNLQRWLSSFALPHSAADNAQLLVLRAQCLAALVFAANILEPHETTYDSYGPEFEEIVALVEALSQDSRYVGVSSSASSGSPLSFTPEMGIIQPLFFTVLKYRHPFWRRKAISLLLKSGREGPWCGQKEAAVGLAVVEAEERPAQAASADGQISTDPALYEPSAILERQRIHAGWVLLESGGGGDRSPGTQSRHANLRLVRCRDLDRVLLEGMSEPCLDPWKDERYWDVWTKVVNVPGDIVTEEFSP